jgi:replicative DNA helicase
MVAIQTKTPMPQLIFPLDANAVEAFQRAPIALCDAGSVSLDSIKQAVEARPGLRLLIVDHLQRIISGRRDRRDLEVGEVARGLKSIAKDAKCTVVALCHMNRGIENPFMAERRPQKADVRDSGEIEQEADVLIFLHAKRADLTLHQMPCQLVIGKNRHGEEGDVPMIFDKPARRFR